VTAVWRRGLAMWLACAALAVALAGCALEEEHTFAGTLLDPPQPVADFTLDSVSDAVRLSDFRGQYVLLYFGYTYCPDFCPTSMSAMARVRRELGGAADRVQGIMVSVDPGRDTPTILSQYVRAFDPTFIGLTGAAEAIDAAGAPFGLFYEIREGSAASGYLVDHTTPTYLIDPEGNLLMVYPYDTPASGIVADLLWFFENES
jgi:protein SCO1/2